MKVIKAKVLGFCMGVRSAVDLVTSAASGNEKYSVFTLGSLIHNPKVLDDLKALGVRTVTYDQIMRDKLVTRNCTVVIRAHGISPGLEKYLRSKDFKVIDATCPRVKTNQIKTQELSQSAYCIFIAGETNEQGLKHAELAGLLGYANTAPFNAVVSNAEEARLAASSLYKINENAKTALLGQTTISNDEYQAIANEIKKYFPNLEIINTICAATNERQDALREILTETDAIIVAGGEESANTRRLFAIAKESGKPCVLVENAKQIPEEFFSYDVIGISAGASTPDTIIDEIEQTLINNI